MLAPIASGILAVCMVTSQAAAPSRVVVLPTEIEGDIPKNAVESFGTAATTGITDAGAEQVDAPSGCANEKCAGETAGPGGYVLVTKVVIKGSDYVVNTKLVDGGGNVVDEQSEPCDICTYEEVAEALQGMVKKGVEPVAEAAPPPPPPDPGPPPPPVVEPKKRKGISNAALGGLGYASIGVGAGALVGGVILFVLDEKPVRNNCDGSHIDDDGDCEFRYNTIGGGAGLAITGALAIGAGVGLLLLKRAREKGELRKKEGAPKTDVALSPGGVRIRF